MNSKPVCEHCPFGFREKTRNLAGYHRCEWAIRTIRRKNTDAEQAMRALRASTSARGYFATEGTILVKGCTKCEYESKI